MMISTPVLYRDSPLPPGDTYNSEGATGPDVNQDDAGQAVA
jgi:hypothetical protein